MSKINVNFLKDEYENINLVDIIRIIKDRMVLYYKIDIKSIVNYIKEYIPDNYGELSDDEINNLNIPKYKDLKHKEIMTMYVKRNIDNKEIRQVLFYVLRNYDYMNDTINII